MDVLDEKVLNIIFILKSSLFLHGAKNGISD